MTATERDWLEGTDPQTEREQYETKTLDDTAQAMSDAQEALSEAYTSRDNDDNLSSIASSLIGLLELAILYANDKS